MGQVRAAIDGWRRTLASLCIACALAATAATSSRAHGAEVEPLRSTELETQLTAAGFDASQRERVLADHAAYVERFTEVVAKRLVEWQAIARTQSATIEEARALQSKSRAAAAAIDDAERPLLDGIRAVARPEQASALARVIALLEIRRDLAIARAVSSGSLGGRALDVRDAVDGLQLSAESMAALEPVLSQYLAERQTVVHRIREATLGVPVRRFEAVLKHPAPAPPSALREGEDDAAMHAWLDKYQAHHRTVSEAANSEQAAARVKATELDFRTLDSLCAGLSGREQARLVCRWWDGNGVMEFHRVDSGTRALQRAWASPKDGLSTELAQRLDAICMEWIAQWWPVAKEAIAAKAGHSETFFFALTDGDDAMSPKVAQANAATTRAREAIALAIDGRVAESVPVVTIAPNVAVTGTGGGAATTVVTGDADGAQFQVAAVMAEGISLDGGELSFEGGIFDGEMLGLDGGDGMLSFTVMGDGPGSNRPSPLPRLIDFEEIRPVLVAAGVDGAMLGVAETAFDDLRTDANALVKESEAGQSRSFSYAFDQAARSRRWEQDSALRARLLAMEATTIDEVLAAVVPTAGMPCVSWIAPWRQFVSERAALSVGDFFGMGSAQPDPTQAVRSAALHGNEWRAVGPELAAVCTDLSSRSRAAVRAAERALAAIPMPTQQDDGTVPGVSLVSSAQDEFMRLHGQADESRQAVRKATMQSIPKLKAQLPAEAAQRLQDAWDDQLYARDLQDPTVLTSRFDGALALGLAEELRPKVVALQSSWIAASRSARATIVALKAQAPTEPDPKEDPAARKRASAERKVKLQAAKFERDELNRRVFRELCALIGEEHASRLQPLPKGKSPRGGIEILGGSFTTQPVADSAPPAPSAP